MIGCFQTLLSSATCATKTRMGPRCCWTRMETRSKSRTRRRKGRLAWLDPGPPSRQGPLTPLCITPPSPHHTGPLHFSISSQAKADPSGFRDATNPTHRFWANSHESSRCFGSFCSYDVLVRLCTQYTLCKGGHFAHTIYPDSPTRLAPRPARGSTQNVASISEPTWVGLSRRSALCRHCAVVFTGDHFQVVPPTRSKVLKVS